MAKIRYEKDNERDYQFRLANWKRHFRTKYKDLFISNFKIEGIDYQQQHYFLEKMFDLGKIAVSPLKHSKTPEHPEGDVILTDFAPLMYNIYNYPIQVNLINTRGVSFIPSSPLDVDTDVVIGYATKTKESIYNKIAPLIDRLVNIAMLLDSNMNQLKMPFLVAVSPEDKARMQSLIDSIMDGNDIVFLSAEEIAAIKTFLTQAPYYLDKLHAFEMDTEAQILTILGIDNVGIQKKERMLVDEVNANNMEIEQSGNIYLDNFKDLFVRVKEVLGVTITIEKKVAENPFEEPNEKEEEAENEY